MIRDYPELIAEICARSGVSDVANRADMLVGMAERMLSKRLRLAGMEKSVEATTGEDGLAYLPGDYQEMRSVHVGTRPLERLPLGAVSAGRRDGYAVQGRKLRSTRASTPHQLVYYAALPSLETDNTSWLLDDEPELYLHATLLQAYLAENDLEKVEATAGYLTSLIEAANRADHMARLAGTRISFVGSVS
ncbi:MAG: hypothetical protein V6Z86_10030 [Hyphomicrobiales bacterium]